MFIVHITSQFAEDQIIPHEDDQRLSIHVIPVQKILDASGDVREALARIPGVVHVCIIDRLPLSGAQHPGLRSIVKYIDTWSHARPGVLDLLAR
jgi:hypothetical protein